MAALIFVKMQNLLFKKTSLILTTPSGLQRCLKIPETEEANKTSNGIMPHIFRVISVFAHMFMCNTNSNFPQYHDFSSSPTFKKTIMGMEN